MKIVYNKKNGEIISAMSLDQDPLRVYRDFDKSLTSNLECLIVDEVPQPLYHYYVSSDTNIVKYDSNSIDEIERYGEVLTDEERLLNILKPSQKEIEKAKMQIEILSTLQEVL